MPVDAMGYKAGTELREVPLWEAEQWECNQCGACCDGLRDNVNKDEATGLPLMTWGSKYPEDLYEERYGKRMLQPIVMGDGGPQIGDEFEVDSDGKPYTCFSCSFLEETGDKYRPTRCQLYDKYQAKDLSTIRPRNCGEFPIFGFDIISTIWEGNGYVPATGAMPECTWHGIRVVGPLRNTAASRQRWEEQQEEKHEESV